MIQRLFVLAFLFIGVLYPQSQRMQRLTIDDGLSQNLAFCILQDSRGFMWFGTKEGLNKYDGYTFTVYKHNEADTASLSNNYVSCLIEDRSGDLWVGTAFGGVCRFDRNSGKFFRYRHQPGESNSITSNHVNALYQDRAGNIWIATDLGTNMLDPVRGTVKRFRHDPGDPSSISLNDSRSIEEDAEGNLWVATFGGGVNRFNPSRGNWKRYVHDPNNPGSIAGDNVYDIHRSRDGSLWFGIDQSLDRFDGEKFNHYIISDQYYPHYNITRIVEDQQGTFWLTAFFCLIRFDPATSQYEFVRREPSTSSTEIDDNDILWIGTLGWGIDRFPSGGNRFALYDDQNIVRILHGGLLSKLSSALSKDITQLYHFVFPQSFAEDKEGNTWIATVYGELFQHDRRKKKFEEYLYNPQFHREDGRRKLYCIEIGPSERIWMGAQYGICEFDRSTKKFNYRRLYPDTYSIAGYERLSGSYDITALYEDSAGIVWIGTSTIGLVRFDPATGSIAYHAYRADDTTSLSTNFILSIEPDPIEPARYLWLGTDGGGVNKFDKGTGKAVRFTEANGFPNNVVYGVLADNAGYLWMSTNRGICRMNAATYDLRLFDVHDGLQANEFNRREFFRTKEGRMFFGGTRGVNAFLPKEVKDNQHIPPVVITDFKIFSRSALRHLPNSYSLSDDDTLVLNYSDNMISFEFAALDFTAPQKNRYAYKLEGFDPRWIDNGTNRTATYTNLDPGRYLFRVKGSNNDGVWNETGTSLTLIIAPPFWMTWWFRTILVLLAISGVAAIVTVYDRRRTREQMLQAEQEAALERERLRIARDMHDDLGSRLTEIGLIGDSARKENTEGVHRHIDRMTNVARESVAVFDEIVWAVNPRYDRIDHVADYFTQYAAEFLASANIRCKLDLPEQLPETPVAAEVRHNLFMIFKEALNNTVKHAQAETVSIRFFVENNLVQLSVIDDGKGFENGEKAFSEGLESMKQRAEKIQGSIRITGERGKGTTVMLTVPLNNIGV